MPILTREMIQEMAPALKGKAGAPVIDFLLKALWIERLNDENDRIADLSAPDFAKQVLGFGGVNYRIGNYERLQDLPEGAFITVSNHPYGGIDGMILVDLLGHIRSDYKVLVNKFLTYIKPLSPSFITVIPKTNDTKGIQKESISGIKGSISHLAGGHPLGIFPSGAVSDLHPLERQIRDREWLEPVLRLIQKARVPILPVRFFDRNSMIYYLLGLISWKIRLLRLPREILNKTGNLTRVGIGRIITPEEQGRHKDIKDFGNLLRESVYGMELPDSFTPRHEIAF